MTNLLVKNFRCRCYELVWHVAVCKHIMGPLAEYKTELEAAGQEEVDAVTTAALAAAASVKGVKARKAATKAAEEKIVKKEVEVGKEVKKKVATKKTALVKEATKYFQQRFEGPLGKGLRCFHPEPAKGGNSNNGAIFFRPIWCSFLM